MLRKALAVWLMLAGSCLATTHHWTGNAQAIKQVDTFTPTLTWATGDTATLTINKKSLTVTVGAAVTPTDVAAALAAAVNASDATTGLVGTESRNFGGQEIPEFTEVVASSSGAVLTLKSVTAGVPFTVTASEVTAGTGIMGSVTHATAATGPNFVDNANNYDTAALPADNDTLYFDSGSTSVLHALDYFRTNARDLTIVISNDYTGQIGNPSINPIGYREYRPLYFQYRGGTKSISFVEGTSGVAGQGNCWIDLQDQASVTLTSNVKRGSGTAPTVFLAGGDATTQAGTWTIRDGLIAIDPDDASLAAGKSFYNQELFVGTTSGDAPIVTIGSRARLYIGSPFASEITMLNGTLRIDAATSAGIGSDQAVIVVRGGTLNLVEASIGPTMTVYSGATLNLIGGGQTEKITLFGGSLDCRLGSDLNDVQKVVAYAGSSVYDPAGRAVSSIDLVGCKPSQVTTDLPPNRLLGFSSAATQ
jgi:hypothetical protein